MGLESLSKASSLMKAKSKAHGLYEVLNTPLIHVGYYWSVCGFKIFYYIQASIEGTSILILWEGQQALVPFFFWSQMLSRDVVCLYSFT